MFFPVALKPPDFLNHVFEEILLAFLWRRVPFFLAFLLRAERGTEPSQIRIEECILPVLFLIPFFHNFRTAWLRWPCQIPGQSLRQGFPLALLAHSDIPAELRDWRSAV